VIMSPRPTIQMRCALAFACREGDGDADGGLFAKIGRAPGRSQKGADCEQAKSENEAREHRAGDHRGFPSATWDRETTESLTGMITIESALRESHFMVNDCFPTIIAGEGSSRAFELVESDVP